MKKRKMATMMFLLLAVLLTFSMTASAAVKAKKVKLNKKKLTLTVGESAKLKATITPKKANQKVKWKSSNKSVASVSSKGVVKGKKAGTATITCSSKKNPKVKATCKVTVKKKGESSSGKDDNGETGKDGNGETGKDDGKKELTDAKELENAKLVMARTCEPIYLRKFKNQSVSSKTGPNGGYKWFVSTNANGTINYITVCDDNFTDIARSYCMYNSPLISHGTQDGGSSIRSAVMNGSYDFKSDPKDVQLVWSAFSSTTSKEDLEKMLNHTVSDEVYNAVNTMVKNASMYYTNSTYGGSCVIVYGKDENNVLIGKYAGMISYNMVTNAVNYALYGVNPANVDAYGKKISGYAYY